MTEQLFARQGDVLIFKRADNSQIPETVPAKLTLTNDLVVATGSSNGNKHQIRNLPAFGSAQSEEGTSNLFVDLTTDAVLVHEEHGPIQLAAGSYRIGIQKSYAPGDIRNIED